MDHQRKIFYSMRQQVLEGRDLEGMVMEMIEQVVDRAVDSYLTPGYAQRCIAEWAGKALLISVDSENIRGQKPEELPILETDLRSRAKEEASNTITMTIGEYMDEELPQRDWDLRGLSSWAMSRFGVSFTQGQLRKMDPDEVELALIESAAERIDEIQLTGVGKFLEPSFPQAALAEWASGTFDIEVQLDQLDPDQGDAAQAIMDLVQAEYQKREIEYPVDYAIGMTVGQAGADNVYALGNLVEWANSKYDAGLTVDDIRDVSELEIRQRLIELARKWTTGGQLDRAVGDALGSDPDGEAAVQFAKQRFDTELNIEDLNGDAIAAVTAAGRKFLRREMTELERFVLLQIFDSSWIDHLQTMTNLKDGIGLRSFAQQDPRVAYKSEGANIFLEALDGIREKVSDMIFKVRLTANEKAVSQYNLSDTVHEQLSGYDNLSQDMAERQAAAPPARPQTFRRDMPKVGRNDPCPCSSGKKFKKCCGKMP